MSRVVQPLMRYAVYAHYDHYGDIFFIGYGKGYEWRRYSKRPDKWVAKVGGPKFSARVICHDLDEAIAKRVCTAIVWYYHQRAKTLLNEVVKPKTDIEGFLIRESEISYLTSIFGRFFRTVDLYLRITIGKRNFHKDFLSNSGKLPNPKIQKK